MLVTQIDWLQFKPPSLRSFLHWLVGWKSSVAETEEIIDVAWIVILETSRNLFAVSLTAQPVVKPGSLAVPVYNLPLNP